MQQLLIVTLQTRVAIATPARCRGYLEGSVLDTEDRPAALIGASAHAGFCRALKNQRVPSAGRKGRQAPWQSLQRTATCEDSKARA